MYHKHSNFKCPFVTTELCNLVGLMIVYVKDISFYYVVT